MEAIIVPVMEELKLIRKELHEIKESMPDKDMFLSPEEKKLLAASFDHQKEGSLISSENLRKELGL